MDNTDYRKLFLGTLVLVVILILVLSYFFFIKPSINGYVIGKQVEAKDMTIIAIVDQIQQQGYAQLVIGNQTLILVPYDPNQAQQPQQAPQ